MLTDLFLEKALSWGAVLLVGLLLSGCGTGEQDFCDLNEDGDCSTVQAGEEEGYELTSSPEGDQEDSGEGTFVAAVESGGPMACHEDDCICHRLNNGEDYADPELYVQAKARGDLDDLLAASQPLSAVRLVPQSRSRDLRLQLDMLALQADFLESGISLEDAVLGDGTCSVIELSHAQRYCSF